MSNQAGLADALSALRSAGFEQPARIIVWNKETPGLGGGLRHQVEYVLVGRLPDSRVLVGSDLVAVPSVGPNTGGRYPTQKPDDLGRVLARVAHVTVAVARERLLVRVRGGRSGVVVRRAKLSLEGRRAAGPAAYRNSARSDRRPAPTAPGGARR
jgi:hypothetical protein